MAIGDFKGNIENGTINTEIKTFTFQPASGEVWKVRSIYAYCTDITGSNHGIKVNLTDGSFTATPIASYDATANDKALFFGEISNWSVDSTNSVNTPGQVGHGNGAGAVIAFNGAQNAVLSGSFLIDNTHYMTVTIQSASSSKTYEIYVDAVEVRSA